MSNVEKRNWQVKLKTHMDVKKIKEARVTAGCFSYTFGHKKSQEFYSLTLAPRVGLEPTSRRSRDNSRILHLHS